MHRETKQEEEERTMNTLNAAAIVKQIDAELTRLRAVRDILAGNKPHHPNRRVFSAESKRRMAVAQTARWAKFRRAAK